MATTTRIVMPQLGESVHEGTISKWLVKPGDSVVEFEPMLEVDTDKVSAEVPSPVTGVLREILAKEGETVSAGAEIAVVELGGDGAEAVGVAAGEASPAAEPAPRPSDSGPRAAKPSAQDTASAGQALAPHRDAAISGESGQEHRYSPAVQMLAAEKKVDLSRLRGTGIGGRVTKKDVLQFAERPKDSAAAKAEPTQRLGPGEGDEVVPLTRIRKLIGENMARSKATIPHAWQTQEVDMSGVVANRGANKEAFQKEEGFSLTYLPYVIAAAATALREHREVNATFNETELIVHRQINIGVSVGLEDTLIVPVIRKADGLSIAGIARAVNDVASRARSKQLKADDLSGGTFTVNNSGTFGTLFSYSVINPGQAGILTMEAIVERPVAVKGMIGIRPLMYLCFSFDHRVLDGLMAARFLTTCRKWLEAVTPDSPIY